MSTVNLNTKDVLVNNNNTDPISLLRKGIIKRDSLVGAKEFITIPKAPENFAKRINASVPVTIDGIKVRIGDTDSITKIYAESIHAEVTTVEEVVNEPVHVEPEVVVEETVEPTDEVVEPTEEELTAIEKEQQLSEDIAQAEVGVDSDEDVIEEEDDEVEEETVESSNNNNQNNQFNYKKKRRR